MQFEIGDIVALTGGTMLDISLTHPKVFEKLREGKRTGGRITGIYATPRDGYKCIEVDMGDSFECPLTFEIDVANPQLTFQLIKKADSQELIGARAPEGVVVGPASGAMPDTALAPPAQAGIIPPPVVAAIQELALRDANAVGRNGIPQQIHLAQWVMSQFIGLKQYVIVQDLNRDTGEEDTQNAVSGDEWKRIGAEDGGKTRRIQLTLAEGEEQLYGAAMTRIKDWIEHVDVVPEAPAAPSIVVPTMPAVVAEPVSDYEEIIGDGADNDKPDEDIPTEMGVE